MGCFFIGEFKTEGQEFKVGEEKKMSLNGQLLKSTKTSQTKHPQQGAWLFVSSVAGNVFM